MSTDYYAHVMVGVKASRKDFYEMVGVRGCTHNHDSPFCPECGKPRLTEKERPLLGWSEYESVFHKTLKFRDAGDEAQNGILGYVCATARPLGIAVVKDETYVLARNVADALKGTKFEDRPIGVYVMLEVNG
jgi:hypothetical protein